MEIQSREHLTDKCVCGHEEKWHGKESGFCHHLRCDQCFYFEVASSSRSEVGARIREIALELNQPLSSETRSRLLRELVALSVGL